MKSILVRAVLISLLFTSVAAQAAAPVVSNIRASQRPGTKLVDVYYDLSDSDSSSLYVTAAVSTNDGATFDLPASSFSDGGSTKSIGSGVSPGNSRWFVWNAGADWNGKLSSIMKFRVAANDDLIPSGMVLIPAGSFVMGATTNVGHEWFSARELPQHTVYVSAFYMGKYEVTKALWDDVATWAAANGYDISASSGSGKAANHPVQTVTWYECVKWCNARSEREGLTPCYTTNGVTYRTGEGDVVCNWSVKGYRLPTEAEWEKAARGGTANHRFPWSNSDEIQHARANYYSWEGEAYDTSPTRGYHPTFNDGSYPYTNTSPVGYFAVNGCGLYDMAGNVWEWCWDWHSSSFYSISPGTDPRGPASGTYRVLRGGSWDHSASSSRVAFRNDDGLPTHEITIWGFRCARGL